MPFSGLSWKNKIKREPSGQAKKQTLRKVKNNWLPCDPSALKRSGSWTRCSL